MDATDTPHGTARSDFWKQTVAFWKSPLYRHRRSFMARGSILSEAADARQTSTSAAQAPSSKLQAVGCAVNNLHAAPVAIRLARSIPTRRSVLPIAPPVHPMHQPSRMRLVAVLRPGAKPGRPCLSDWSPLPSMGCVRWIANPCHKLRLRRSVHRRMTVHEIHLHQLRTDDDLRNFNTRNSRRSGFQTAV